MKKNYYEIPRDLLRQLQIKLLMKKHGAFGLGLFISVFMKCYDEIENGSYLEANNFFYKLLAYEGNTRVGKIKQVINTMVDIGIIDKTLFEESNIIFITMLSRLSKKIEKIERN